MAKGDHEKGKGLAIGAAVGAVIGVVVGVLFAPQSGKETRADIKDTATKAMDKVVAEAKKLQNELGSLIDSGEEKIKDAGRSASKKAKDLVEQAPNAQDALKVLVKSVKAGEADDKDLNKAIKKAKEARDSLKAYLKK